MKKEQYIKETFNKMTPSEEQKNKIYNNILETYKSNDQRASIVYHKNKILKKSAVIAACAALAVFVSASIIKTAQNLNIKRPATSVDSTEQITTTVAVTDVTSQSDPTEKTQITANKSSLFCTGEMRFANGKKYYAAISEPEKEYSFKNINLSDNTSSAATGSILYSFPGSLIYDNALYSLYYDSESNYALIRSDAATGETLNKTDLQYHYNNMCADKDGNIYVSTVDSFAIYSKDLKFVYSISNEELIKKLSNKTTDKDFTDIFIGNMTVSPDGEIYLFFYNKGRNVSGLCKLNSDYEIEFISDEFNDFGNTVSALYVSDNGNLIACIDKQDTESTSIIEISSMTGEITANYGQEYLGAQYFGFWKRNILSINVTQSNYICSYNIDTQTSEKIFLATDFVSNAILNNDTLTVVQCTNYNYENADYSYIFVENSDGNIEKQIPLGHSAYDIFIDVTQDETIYYIVSDYNKVISENPEQITNSVYTIDDGKPKKLFNFLTTDALYSACPFHVSSAGSNGDIYICVTDNNVKSKLYVYDNSGNFKSQTDIPEQMHFITHMANSGSELILAGLHPLNSQNYMMSINTDTLEAEEPRLIDSDSEIVSKDGLFSISYSSKFDTLSIEKAVK